MKDDVIERLRVEEQHRDQIEENGSGGKKQEKGGEEQDEVQSTSNERGRSRTVP